MVTSTTVYLWLALSFLACGHAEVDSCFGVRDPPFNSTNCTCEGGCGTNPEHSIRPSPKMQKVDVAFNRVAIASSHSECRFRDMVDMCFCEIIGCYDLERNFQEQQRRALVQLNCNGAPPTPSCAAVNGVRTGKYANSRCGGQVTNCFFSGPDDTAAYWIVDLVKPYSLAVLDLYGPTIPASPTDWYERYMGLTVYGDAEVCYTFPGYNDSAAIIALSTSDRVTNSSSHGPRMRVSCDMAWPARLVRLQKDATASNNSARFLQLCELVINVCPEGYYLDGNWTDYRNFDNFGCNPCPAECLFPCDNLRGCSAEVISGVLGNHTSILINQTVEGNAVYVDNTKQQIVTTDGQRTLMGQWLCYESQVITNSFSLPLYMRVNLPTFFLFLRAAVYFKAGYHVNFFGVFVSDRISNIGGTPQDSIQICWEIHQNTSGFYDMGCRNCSSSNNFSGCPVGAHITFHVNTDIHSFQVCEIEAYGYQAKVRAKLETCSTSCLVGKCPDGTACSRGKCRFKPGVNCTATDECITGAECERDVCRSQARFACRDNDDCLPGLRCDSNVCLAQFDVACRDKLDCVKTLECSTKHLQCKYGPNWSCFFNDSYCAEIDHKPHICNVSGKCSPVPEPPEAEEPEAQSSSMVMGGLLGTLGIIAVLFIVCIIHRIRTKGRTETLQGEIQHQSESIAAEASTKAPEAESAVESEGGTESDAESSVVESAIE